MTLKEDTELEPSAPPPAVSPEAESHKPVVTAVAAPKTSSASGPPGQCAVGGTWGKLKYAGDTTKLIACLGCLCCGPLACCVFICPQDELDAYKVQNKVYDAAGVQVLGSTGSFIPVRQTMSR